MKSRNSHLTSRFYNDWLEEPILFGLLNLVLKNGKINRVANGEGEG